MKRIFFSLFALLAVAFAAFAAEPHNYNLKVNDFTSLKVIDSINVEYVGDPNSEGSASYVATADMASLLVFSNNKGTLEITLADNTTKYTGIPTVTVSSKFLTKVENDGDSTVRVSKVAPMPEFKARLVGNGRLSIKGLDTTTAIATIDSGNGTIVIDGKSTTAKFNNTGAGTIQADRLVATDVKCRQIGTGSIGCLANGKLAVFGAGSGYIYYRGKPSSIQKRTIGIKLSPIDEE